MANNRNDLKTEIFNVAAEMFHDLGYQETTFQLISDKLGITKGAITYHFKNKHVILAILFDDAFKTIRDYIDQFPEAYRNRYWRICVMYIYFYRIIMSKERNISLFYHRNQLSLWEAGKADSLLAHYQDILEDFHRTMTSDELTITVYSDLGVRRRLYREFMEGNPLLTDIDKFVFYHIQLIGTLCRLDQAQIQENINWAFEFANSHPAPRIPFLTD